MSTRRIGATLFALAGLAVAAGYLIQGLLCGAVTIEERVPGEPAPQARCVSYVHPFLPAILGLVGLGVVGAGLGWWLVPLGIGAALALLGWPLVFSMGLAAFLPGVLLLIAAALEAAPGRGSRPGPAARG